MSLSFPTRLSSDLGASILILLVRALPSREDGAAVCGYPRARNEPRIVAREKEDHVGDIFGDGRPLEDARGHDRLLEIARDLSRLGNAFRDRKARRARIAHPIVVPHLRRARTSHPLTTPLPPPLRPPPRPPPHTPTHPLRP